MRFKTVFIAAILLGIFLSENAQAKKGSSKAISPDLFGIFFEDINYAADGGLYAELVQNRSFEYSLSDHNGWNSFTAWEYITKRLWLWNYLSRNKFSGQPK